MPGPPPPDVDTAHTDLLASPPGVADAPPEPGFDSVRRPPNHPPINGAGSVRGARSGPDPPPPGDRFGMRMKALGVPYRTMSKVVELDEGRRIAWRLTGGHVWRWEMEPEGSGTRVTETFDISTAPTRAALRLLRLPRHHELNLARS